MGVLILAFFAFSLCASSVYICNDLLDLEVDRKHPRKRSRPFASGIVPVWIGVLVAPMLLVFSLGTAAMVGQEFLSWLIFYFALADTSYYYPEDRGISESIGFGRKMAKIAIGQDMVSDRQ